jgi:DNA-binding protein HU-beta
MSNGNGVTAAISSAADTVSEKASEVGSVIAGTANMAVSAAKKQIDRAGKTNAGKASKRRPRRPATRSRRPRRPSA